MDNNVFINTGVDYAITMFLRSKDRPYSTLYSSFLVVVIRALIVIYGELEIIGSYSKNDESSFRSLIGKYGYAKVNKFEEDIQKYYEWAKNAKDSVDKKNIEFTLIQQELIDMAKLKMVSLGNNDLVEEFTKLLYTPSNMDPNMVLFNMQVSVEPSSIEFYWGKTLLEIEEPLKIITKKYNLLNPKFYQTINLTLEEVQKMSEAEIEEKNQEIFKKFRVKLDDPNLAEKLNKAVDNFLNPNIELTSGSGFADRMLLVSIMVTLVCIAFIAGVMIFG